MNDRIKKVIKEAFDIDMSNVVIEYIKSGLTNENYYMTYRNEKYVIRISNVDIDGLTINRSAERAAMVKASTIGVCPEIVYFSTESGNMITKFINGSEWTKEEFSNPEVINKVVSTLKKVHNLPAIPYSFSPYDDIENRIKEARDRKLNLPSGIDIMLEKMHDIKAERAESAAVNTGLCHNDPFANNFLYDGTVRLLDWEFAGMGDILFDLACLVKNYSNEQREYMLKCYFGESTPELMHSLDQMRYIVKFWNAMWAVLRAQSQQHGFDYSSIAKNIFISMENGFI